MTIIIVIRLNDEDSETLLEAALDAKRKVLADIFGSTK
jgi:hypothetical protein